MLVEGMHVVAVRALSAAAFSDLARAQEGIWKRVQLPTRSAVFVGQSTNPCIALIRRTSVEKSIPRKRPSLSKRAALAVGLEKSVLSDA